MCFYNLQMKRGNGMGIKLSACTITKNEAENIKKSIDSYKDYVDEIIIVDTGSVDDTVEIAKANGAKVFNFEWENDFSAAKNFALDNCTGDWVIFLDADEWFNGDDAKNIKNAINNTIKSGYQAVSSKLVNFADENEVLEVGCTTRIFKRDKDIRFERAIHEVLFNKGINEPLESLYSELITINHSGYMRKVLKNKAKRNKRLLERAYAEGKVTPIDYFYGLRENLGINLELSDYFFKLINNTPDYREKISKYNIGSILDDNLVKLVNNLSNKYSFEERMDVLKTAQSYFPDNPIFKYYEYNMFCNINKKRAILALEDAVELSKNYEKNHPDRINSFYIVAGEAFTALGEYELLLGDKSKALEYFTSAVKFEYDNIGALNGLLYIVKEQKNEDILIFLNSIYDINNKDVLKFLVEALRLTAFHDIFLYYFVNYNKKFNEVDAALFTSRIITGNFDEIIDTYMNVFYESKDSRALRFVASAIISGNRKEKYSDISANILPVFSKIINAYFNNETLESISDNEYVVALDIFREISFIASEDVIKKYISIFKVVGEKIWVDIIKYYFDYYEYGFVLKLIAWISDAELDSKDLVTYINYILTKIYFRNGEFDKIEDSLDKVISGGFLDVDLMLICEMLEASDDKLDEYYNLFDAQVEMRKLECLDNFKDMSSDSIFFMNVEKFSEEIRSNLITGVKEQVKEFFEFANKAFEKKTYAYAEKYYKIALKFNYCVDRCYYYLGMIYNHFNNPDLSFYCYEKAFCENLLLAKDILPKGHKNCNYVFSKKEEEYNKVCPICGKEVLPFKTYVNIDDVNLSYNESLISTYMKCEDCNHIFLKNDIKDKNFWRDANDNKVNDIVTERFYKIFEEIGNFSDEKRLIAFTNNEYFIEVGKNSGYEISSYLSDNDEKYDIVFSEEYINESYELDERMKLMLDKMETDGVLILSLYDYENLYSKFIDKPLWARVNIKNVFSHSSIKKLLAKYDLKVIKTKVDNLDKGKVLVFASL